MNKQNIIQITLFISILVFNPVVADTFRLTVNIQTNFNTTITKNIASTLYKRGLEEKSAKKIAEEFIKDDEEVFALMLENFLYACNDITKEEIFEYLGTAALHRRNITLDSYDQLIDIYSKTKKSTPDERVRQKLSAVAKKNTLIFGQADKKAII